MENKLYEIANRYLAEEPIEEPGAPEFSNEPDIPNDVDAPVDQGDENIKIYYSNLDEESQKTIMDAIKDEINASDDDTYSEDKIVEALSKTPIVDIRSSDLARQMNINV